MCNIRLILAPAFLYDRGNSRATVAAVEVYRGGVGGVGGVGPPGGDRFICHFRGLPVGFGGGQS